MNRMIIKIKYDNYNDEKHVNDGKVWKYMNDGKTKHWYW